MPLLLVVSNRSRVGWKTSPAAAGSSVVRSFSRNAGSNAAGVWPRGGAIRRLVTVPKRLPNRRSPAAVEMYAFGVVLWRFQ